MRKYFDQITRIAGNVVTVTATGVGYDELATITGPHRSSLAQVIRLEGDQVSLQVFAGTQGVSTVDRVHFLGRPSRRTRRRSAAHRSIRSRGSSRGG